MAGGRLVTTHRGGEDIMTSTTRWAAPVSLCTAAIFSIPAALAQDNANDRGGPIRLEEIVGTATKRSETLQDVPVAVTAISSEEIAARGFANYSEYINT